MTSSIKCHSCFSVCKYIISLWHHCKTNSSRIATCQHVYKPSRASWGVSSPVTEVRGILEVVIVILRCEDVADEVVVEVVVWLVVVVWVVTVVDIVVLVGWLALAGAPGNCYFLISLRKIYKNNCILIELHTICHTHIKWQGKNETIIPCISRLAHRPFTYALPLERPNSQFVGLKVRNGFKEKL